MKSLNIFLYITTSVIVGGALGISVYRQVVSKTALAQADSLTHRDTPDKTIPLTKGRELSTSNEAMIITQNAFELKFLGATQSTRKWTDLDIKIINKSNLVINSVNFFVQMYDQNGTFLGTANLQYKSIPAQASIAARALVENVPAEKISYCKYSIDLLWIDHPDGIEYAAERKFKIIQ